jgi:hypothetical protein
MRSLTKWFGNSSRGDSATATVVPRTTDNNLGNGLLTPLHLLGRTIERWPVPDFKAPFKRRRIMTKPTGMVMAAGVTFAAVLIGLAPAARADEPDPFQLLFGDSGINTWTPTADTDLAALSPTLASDLVTSVDGYEQGTGGFYASDPFTVLADHLDPSAFSANPDGVGLLPDNGIGDLAVGLDYTVFSTGGYGSVDLLVDGLLAALGVPGLVGF